MTTKLQAGLIALLVLSGPAAFGGDASPEGPDSKSDTGPRGLGMDVPKTAMEAVTVVDSFSQALARGDLDSAGKYLDSAVLILEHGGSERTAAEYLGGHGQADARFLQDADQKLIYRKARASRDLAWVVTEREIEAMSDGKPVALYSTETMVLRQSQSGHWTIVHIHWSSRRRTAEPSH
jgi:ketosteroid isomerase-like protein